MVALKRKAIHKVSIYREMVLDIEEIALFSTAIHSSLVN
jgi:hypothetical protein